MCPGTLLVRGCEVSPWGTCSRCHFEPIRQPEITIPLALYGQHIIAHSSAMGATRDLTIRCLPIWTAMLVSPSKIDLSLRSK